VEAEWLSVHPGDSVERRHIGVDFLPADGWPQAVAAMSVPESDRTPGQPAAVALAGVLVDELLAADAILLAVPLYNFGVSQHFKTWVDLIMRGADLTVVEREFTLVGVNPALDVFKDAAASLHQGALASAREAGRRWQSPDRPSRLTGRGLGSTTTSSTGGHRRRAPAGSVHEVCGAAVGAAPPGSEPDPMP
jgi:FMN-dependent NADH-azoreductase